MDKKHRELKKYIKKADNILIISHLGPDPDAFCSMLLLKEAIKQVYPNKIVRIKARQMPNFNIPTMNDIEIVDTLKTEDEQLIIITDINDMRMCVEEGDSLENTKAKIVIIDHHSSSADNNILLINEKRSSATEQVYASIKQLFGKKVNITKEMAHITQYGILADTGRFLYNITTPDTLRIFAELKEIDSVDIEEFEYKNGKFPAESLPMIIKLLENIKTEGDMAYSYIDREFLANKTALNEAFRFVKDNVLRYIQGVHWGFLIKPQEKENHWRVSFRSTMGYQKVQRMGEALNGGGHELASGGEIEAQTVTQALEKVLSVVKNLKD